MKEIVLWIVVIFAIIVGMILCYAALERILNL